METGKILKQQRMGRGWTLTEASKKLSISPPHLARIEKGDLNPSSALLERMIEEYQLPFEDALLLRQKISPDQSGLGKPAEVSETSELKPLIAQNPIPHVSVDPLRTPIHYTNVVAVSSDDYGIVIDAGQRVAASNEVQIVSRVGFSLIHGIEIRKALDEHIKKLEKRSGS